jgi:hypothetical protein
MWPMFRTLFHTLSGKTSGKGMHPRRYPRLRPCLEVLEDRAVPASLSYSSLLNGAVYATAVDSAGNVYVTGEANSGFSPTPGAYDTNGWGAFVAKLSPTGNVIYATYLGSAAPGEPHYPAGTGIAVDAAGDAYVIGEGPTVATTANALATADPSGEADFVAELNPTGSALLYGTYLPGTLNDPNLTLGYAGCGWTGSLVPSSVQGGAGAEIAAACGVFRVRRPLGGAAGDCKQVPVAQSSEALIKYPPRSTVKPEGGTSPHPPNEKGPFQSPSPIRLAPRGVVHSLGEPLDRNPQGLGQAPEDR